jgi:hypothetical protein
MFKCVFYIKKNSCEKIHFQNFNVFNIYSASRPSQPATSRFHNIPSSGMQGPPGHGGLFKYK